MQAKVQKWGNSLAVRIPRAFALEVGLELDTAVDLSIQKGAVVVAPIRQPSYRLEQLLADITPRNRHTEQDWGAPQGREAW